MPCSSFIILLSTGCDSGSPPPSFQRFPNGTPVASSTSVGVQPKKENDNETNSSVKDCLAESAATASSATLGADKARFKHQALSDPGTGLHLCRAVLAHNFEFGVSLRWSSRLGLTLVCRNQSSLCKKSCLPAKPARRRPQTARSERKPRRTFSPIRIHGATRFPRYIILKFVDQVDCILCPGFNQSWALGIVGDWALAHGSSFC